MCTSLFGIKKSENVYAYTATQVVPHSYLEFYKANGSDATALNCTISKTAFY